MHCRNLRIFARRLTTFVRVSILAAQQRECSRPRCVVGSTLASLMALMAIGQEFHHRVLTKGAVAKVGRMNVKSAYNTRRLGGGPA